MICLSYNGTIAQIKHLATEFDAEVLQWSEKLANNIQVCSATNEYNNYVVFEIE